LLDEPPALGELAEEVPPRLTRLVAALLAKDASRRLGEARIVREELAAIRTALAAGDRAALAASAPDVPELPAVEATTRDERPPSRKARRSPRSRARWIGGGLAVAGAVVALSVLAVTARGPAARRDPAGATDRCTDYVRDGCEAACGAGNADACFRWGQGLYTGLGGFTVDRPAAIAAYARGCELGAMEACIKGATSLLREGGGAPGGGAPRDETLRRAERMLAGACERNASQACRLLGLEHAPGGAFADDAARALRFLARACDANDVPACHALRTQLDAGLGDAASRAVAEASHAGACRRKLRLECRK
jgi:hypothetical protein